MTQNTNNNNKKNTQTKDVYKMAIDFVENSIQDNEWNIFIQDISGGWVYGDGNGRYYTHNQGNDFVKRMYELQNISPQHGSICQGKALYVYGNGLYLGEDPSDELVKFYENAPEISAEKAKNDIAKTLGIDYTAKNIRAEQLAGMDLDKLTKLIAHDLVMFGGSYLLVHIQDDKIIKQMHLPYSHIRVSKPQKGDIDELRYYYITADGKVDEKTPRVREFDPRKLDEKIQLVELRMPHCPTNQYLYSKPDYISALKWILLDGYIAEFFNSFATKNFFLGGTLKTGKTPPQKVRNEIKNEIKKKYAGSKNAGEIMFWFGAGKDDSFEPYQIQSSDELFRHQQEYIKYNIRTAHKVTDPALLGLPADVNSGVVFQNPDSLRMSLMVFQSTVIAPIQFTITDWYNDVLSLNGIDESVVLDEFKPFFEDNVEKNQTNDIINDSDNLESDTDVPDELPNDNIE